MIKLFGKSRIMGGDETFEVRRQPMTLGDDANYVDGKLVKTNAICFKAVGNIQPINGRDLLLVPEGDRFKELYYLFLPSQVFTDMKGLMVKDITALIVNDIVIRNGVRFQVQSLEDWGSFSRARIMRIDTGERQTP